MTKGQGKQLGGLRLVLVPNQDDRPTSLSDDRRLWEGSPDFNRAEADMRTEMAQSRGLLAAIRLEQARLLPHHILHDQQSESAIIARNIADRAREYPSEGHPVIGPRARGRRTRTLLSSVTLLPHASGPVQPQSGIVARKVAPETWSGFLAFLARLKAANAVGVFVGDPGLIHLLTEELTCSLGLPQVPSMQDPSFSLYVIPADSGSRLLKRARERLRLTARGRR